MTRTVLHVIHDLRAGGTERRMLTLLAMLDRRRFRPLLCCVDGLGDLAGEARALGLEPVVLGRRGRRDPRGLLRLARVVRAERVDIVHSWLYLANVYGRVGGRLGGATAVVAADGATKIPATPRRRAVAARIDRALAVVTDAVVANSAAVAESLVERGIPQRKVVVIHNGVAIPAPLPDEEAASLRTSLGAQPGERLVAMVARLTSENKDHPTFLRAAALVHAARGDVRFAVVGDGDARPQIESLVDELGLRSVVTLAGYRRDARAAVGALDVSVLCSLYEGFSNVVLESMAAARAVVATDIAPNREAIEDGVHGLLVPLRDPDAAAGAILRLLDDPSGAAALGARARERVAAEFSLEAQARRTEELYERLLTRG